MVGWSGLLAFGEAYGSHGASQFLFLLIAVGIVALAIAGLYLWNMRRQTGDAERRESAENLFDDLCEAHELSRDDRHLIAQVAQLRQLSQPALVFVDPSILERAAETAGFDVPGCQRLRKKLFGTAISQ